MSLQAVVLGATGLVGAHLLVRLLSDARYTQVRALVRGRLSQNAPSLEQTPVDFERLERHSGAFAVDHAFCCLGTTMKKAGSREAFRRVDYDYVYSAARIAASAGVAHFVWISAVGASPHSPAFYSRVKGELEEAIAQLPLARWTAVRPSLLLGPRAERRPAEEFSAAVLKPASRLLVGPLKRYRPIHAAVVADAMIALANGEPAPEGLEIRSGGRGG